MKTEYAQVISKQVANGICDIVLETTIARHCKAGQFINIYLENGTELLPRPISVCQIIFPDRLRIVVANVGKGTDIIFNFNLFQKIKILGPLGNGFDILETKGMVSKPLLVGGGIGIAPLLEVAEKQDRFFNVVLGYRNEAFLEYDFEQAGCELLCITTESGNRGRKGNVMDYINQEFSEIYPSIIYACGPKPMLKALCEWAVPKNIPIQISLEERMACGIGACLSCVCGVKDKEGNITNKRLCKDGPVFWGTEVEWQ